MGLQGKGLYIWRIRDCENGDVNAIVSLAEEARLQHVIIKFADRGFTYNLDPKTGMDLVGPLANALQEKNIQVYGWHFITGSDPLAEADVAARRLKKLGLDGYVIRPEAEYKQPGRDKAADKFMQRLRQQVADLPVGLAAYRFPSLHPQLPWKEFLTHSDFVMPQVFWVKAHNPGDQLKRSMLEFQKMIPYRQIVPTGSVYKYGEWQPTNAEIEEFLATAQNFNVPAVNFWEWARCRIGFPGAWEIIKDYAWDTAPKAADITQQLIAALNQRDPAQIAILYNPDAVLITAEQALQGEGAIQSWYTTVFDQLLPNGRFTLTSCSGDGSVRHLTWTALSAAGSVNNGNDTIGLLNDKIAYHYSAFCLS